ncbi:exopolysaccharide biosynthesis polyprenyl glycosylphosphotransferase [Streptomyces sp. NPDC001536]|uniref:exopolysaccharide biosynthesis polyprenyl glycosylphosphotransferase n=1 Tax=Streptomyces sp. NPDC001536 TaxID=3364583 RepID=UPI0036750451
MKDTAADQEDYAGRVEQEMARRLGLIGASSDSALLRSRFGEYSQLPTPSQSTVTYRRRRRRRVVKRIASAVFRGLLVSVILAIMVRPEGRIESWAWIGASFGVLCLNELVRTRSWPKSSSRADRGRRVVLVGSGERAAEFMGIWEPSWAKISVIGVCVPSDAGAEADPWRKLRIGVMGTLANVREVVTASGADTVIVIPHSGLSVSDLRRLVWTLDDVDTELFLSQSILDLGTSRQSTASVAGLSLIKVNRHKRDGLQARLQAVVDRTLAATLIILLLWPLLLIVLLVRLTSTGPALFRQRRVGRYGEQFTMYKFRTMFADSATLEAEMTQLNYSGDGLLFKVRRDPRITSVGRFLRRTSLDELPQLINVLKGDMSLVGPRPPLLEEVEEYPPEVRRRLLVKPGLTGLWQISGRSDLSWEESVRLDLSYIDNWSFGLNLRILMRTASAVVRGTGAY